jgi:hypothetical protein
MTWTARYNRTGIAVLEDLAGLLDINLILVLKYVLQKLTCFLYITVGGQWDAYLVEHVVRRYGLETGRVVLGVVQYRLVQYD